MNNADIDIAILAAANSPHFRKVAMVIIVAEASCPGVHLHRIARRIRALVGAGRLEGEGNLRNWRRSEVRVVQPPAPGAR